MNIQKLFILSLNLYLQQTLIAQDVIRFGFESYSKSKFSEWSASKKEYVGTYHFGDSEWEWDLDIIITESVICAQKRKSDWVVENGELIEVRHIYLTFNNLTLDKNKIYTEDGTLLIEFMHFNNSENIFNWHEDPEIFNGAVFYRDKPEYGRYQAPFDYVNSLT